MSAPLPWRLVEVFSCLGLLYLILVRARKYNIINVHIAYPLLTYFHIIKRLVRKPLVITEHWSGYHFNFGTKKALPRAQRIFAHKLPLLAVSNSLLADIQKFSGQTLSRTCVIPNCVDSNIFNYKERDIGEVQTFFMLSHWKRPKRPDLIIRAFSSFVRHEECRRNYRLRIAGYGPALPEIQKQIEELGLQNNVTVIGSLDPHAVACEMNNCTAFLHASEYETFSVVCAEAISCGTPVVASGVGAIPEFVNANNGILVSNNTVEGWTEALSVIANRKFDRVTISQNAGQRFSFEAVGKKYYGFLNEICETHR